LQSTFRRVAWCGFAVSFGYFENVIEEVRELKMPTEYWRHLQMRVDRLEQQWAYERSGRAEVRAFVTERAWLPRSVALRAMLQKASASHSNGSGASA
jgi:hypothetical protein